MAQSRQRPCSLVVGCRWCCVCVLMRALVVALAVVSATAVAQPFAPQTMRSSGTIERIDGDDVTIRAIEGGGTNTVHLTKDAAVYGVTRATLADIKPGTFVGAGAVPQADGTQRALRITALPEQLRGLGEGFRPWDRTPGGTMTNATVAETVK